MQRTLLSLFSLATLASARLTMPPRVNEGDLHTPRIGASLPCDAPVGRANVTFGDDLVGRAQHDFGMWSGYVNVTEEDYLFYWMFEPSDAAARADDDTPVIIWSNGGPVTTTCAVFTCLSSG